MKKNSYSLPLSLSLVLLSIAPSLSAQSVGIGVVVPNASAQLEISSPTLGLLIPRMNTAGILSIASPANGLMVYDSARNQLLVNMGTPAAPDWENVAASQGWSLSGVSSSSTNTRFIGTTDGAPLNFRIANTPSGVIDSASQNTYWGYQAGLSNTPDPFNPNPGISNTAVGANALTGDNFDFPFSASNNVAFGAGALSSVTTGNSNIGIGASAEQDNFSGTGNIAVGSGTFLLLGISSPIAAFSNNIAIGFHTGTFLEDQSSNILIGNNVFSPPIGSTTHNFATFNTVVGHNSAKSNFAPGTNYVMLGANCDVGANLLTNIVMIGDGVIATASNTVRIGNAATTSIGGFADWTSFSDGRFKKDLKEDVKGTDFIMRLRPITYHLDITGIQNKLFNGQKRAPHPSLASALANQETTVFSGFSAQEVEKAARDAGYDFSGVDKPSNETGFYGLRYGEFVVPLVKTAQEQQHAIEAMLKKLDRLEKTIQKQ